MDLDFESEQIVFVCYLSGNGGNSVARLISLSPELYWGKEFKQDPNFEKSGRAHYPGVLGAMNEYGLTGPIIGRDKSVYARHLGTGDCPRRDHVVKEFQESVKNLDFLPDKFAHPTHLRSASIRSAFPNAKIIDIKETNQNLAIRLLYEKQWKESLPISISEHLDELPNTDGFIRYRDRMIPEVRINSSLTKSHLRYHLKNRKALRESDAIDCLVVRHESMMNKRWQMEYLRICKFLNITPVLEEANKYMSSYLNKQWKRSLIA